MTRLVQRLQMRMVKTPLEVAPAVIQTQGYEILRQGLVQQFAELTQAEKLLWLQNFLFIMTPDLRRLNDKIAQVRAYRAFGQQRNFLLGGASGMGKTTYLDWYTATYSPLVEAERNYVPIIKIDAPVSNHTPKPLLQRIILECGMNYLRGDNEEDLLMKMTLYFHTCGTELLIVDEVEHIQHPQIRRRLLEISNLTTCLPMICASCHPTHWVQGDSEVAGRWNDYFELRPYKGERLRQLLAFLELLLPFPESSSLAVYNIPTGKREVAVDGPARLIEIWTEGVLRDIMILIHDASQRAIQQGLSHLSPTLLETVWRDIQTRPVQIASARQE